MAELKATPRNPYVGAYADLLGTLKGAADKVQLPVLGGLGGLLMGEFPELVNDVSYQGLGVLVKGGNAATGGIGTFAPDKRVVDAGGLLGMAKPAVQVVKATGKALAPKAGAMAEQFMVNQGLLKPITAYHGSPHTFDKFSLDKIGTGEGAQVYGHGLYFADNPEVAKDYMRQLFTGKGDSPKAMAQLLMAPKEVGGQGLRAGEAQQVLWDRLSAAEKSGGGKVGSEFSKRILEAIKHTQGDVNTGANFYKVDIPDEAVNKMLLWDKPVPEETISKIRQPIMDKFESGPTATSGEKLYKEMVFNFKMAGSKNPNADASAYLRELGVPGVRYFDAGSRGTKEGTMNTVLFDDSLVKILERNGIPMQGLLK